MDKKTIRESGLKARNGLSKEEVQEKSLQILGSLEAQTFFQNSKHVLFYYPHQNEVHTLELIKTYLAAKKIYLPKISRKGEFEPWLCEDLNQLPLNKYGIPEPSEGMKPPHERLDLIILPGVAFDPKGNRIGMGKGYYDRFLAHQKGVIKVALAYENQIFDELPKDPYDEPVDMIITEKRVIHCLKSD